MKLKWSHFLLLVFVLLDLAFLFLVNFPSVEINPYLLRDMDRALLALQGHFIWVGPDFTSGSFTPGPFYYFTILPALAFVASPFALVAYVMLVKVFSQLIFSLSFSRVLKVPTTVLYLVMSSSAFLLERFIWVNNSSLIAPFVQILAVLAIFFWRSTERKKDIWLLSLIGLLAGGSIQIHFSMVFVLPALIMLIQTKGKKSGHSVQDSSLFIAATLIPMLPFLIVYLNDHYLHMFSGPIFFKNELGIHEFVIDWGRIFIKRWRVFHELNIFNLEVILIYFYIVLRALWTLWQRVFKKLSWGFSDKLSIYMGLTALAFAGWILSGSYMRYFTVLFVGALALLISDSYHFLSRYFPKKSWTISVFLLICLTVRAEFYQFPKNLGLQGKCESCIFQMKSVCGYFNSQKISYEQFVKSTYELFPKDSHGSLAYLRYCFDQKEGIHSQSNLRYLFVDSDFLKEPKLLKQTIDKMPLEVRSLYSGKESLKVEVQEIGFTLFSIFSDFPLEPEEQLTNLTYSYQFDPASGQNFILDTLRLRGEQVYKASFCSSPVYCDLFIAASMKERQLRLYFASRAFQTKTSLLPIFGRMRNLKIEVLCDDKPQIISVVSSLGLIAESDQNETFFTPLRLARSMECKSWSLKSVHVDSLELSMNESKNKSWNDHSFPLEPL